MGIGRFRQFPPILSCITLWVASSALWQPSRPEIKAGPSLPGGSKREAIPNLTASLVRSFVPPLREKVLQVGNFGGGEEGEAEVAPVKCVLLESDIGMTFSQESVI